MVPSGGGGGGGGQWTPEQESVMPSEVLYITMPWNYCFPKAAYGSWECVADGKSSKHKSGVPLLKIARLHSYNELRRRRKYFLDRLTPRWEHVLSSLITRLLFVIFICPHVQYRNLFQRRVDVLPYKIIIFICYFNGNPLNWL